MYLTYNEYLTMGGTLAETVFEDYEFGAEALINYATFNRIPTWYPDTLPSVLKRLTKQLIDIAHRQAESMISGVVADSTGATGGRIIEQSNDGVSVKYSSVTSADAYALCQKEANQAVERNLSTLMDSLGRKLLYRGLYEGE